MEEIFTLITKDRTQIILHGSQNNYHLFEHYGDPWFRCGDQFCHMFVIDKTADIRCGDKYICLEMRADEYGYIVCDDRNEKHFQDRKIKSGYAKVIATTSKKFEGVPQINYVSIKEFVLLSHISETVHCDVTKNDPVCMCDTMQKVSVCLFHDNGDCRKPHKGNDFYGHNPKLEDDGTCTINFMDTQQ